MRDTVVSACGQLDAPLATTSHGEEKPVEEIHTGFAVLGYGRSLTLGLPDQADAALMHRALSSLVAGWAESGALTADLTPGASLDEGLSYCFALGWVSGAHDPNLTGRGATVACPSLHAPESWLSDYESELEDHVRDNGTDLLVAQEIDGARRLAARVEQWRSEFEASRGEADLQRAPA